MSNDHRNQRTTTCNIVFIIAISETQVVEMIVKPVHLSNAQRGNGIGGKGY